MSVVPTVTTTTIIIIIIIIIIHFPSAKFDKPFKVRSTLAFRSTFLT